MNDDIMKWVMTLKNRILELENIKSYLAKNNTHSSKVIKEIDSIIEINIKIYESIVG